MSGILSEIGHAFSGAASWVGHLLGGDQAEAPSPAPPAVDPNAGLAEEAKAALADKLHVVYGDGQGPHKPNEVSKEEAEKMQKLYADILGGNSNVVLDGKSAPDPAAFKSGAMGDIAKMMATPAGRTLLEHMVQADKDGKDTTSPLTLAYTGDPMKSHEDRDWDQDSMRYRDSETVTYKPGAGPVQDGVNHFESDVTLFHEMVHAYHDKTHTAAPSGQAVNPVNPADTGVRQEEYNTVGLDRDHHDVATVVDGVPLSEREYRAELEKNGRVVGDRTRYNGKDEAVMQ